MGDKTRTCLLLRNTFSSHLVYCPLLQAHFNGERQKALAILNGLSLYVMSVSELVALYHQRFGWHRWRVLEGFGEGSLAHVLLYEEVPVWSPSGLRKWSRCRAPGSHNPVGHLPCAAPVQPPVESIETSITTTTTTTSLCGGTISYSTVANSESKSESL